MESQADKYILGLDMGTSSVGWALVKVPEDETLAELVDLGVRKFNEVYDAEKKNETKNAARRTARLQRRQIRRKAYRRRQVLRALIQRGLAKDFETPFPDLPENRFSPYDIWARAYDEGLTAVEFGRILFLFAKRRGYQSNEGAGMGDLIHDPEIQAYQEIERKKREREEDRASGKKGKAKSDDGSSDEEGVVLAQLARWEKMVGTLPLGKVLFALANPGEEAKNLLALGLSKETVEAFQPNWEKSQIRNKSWNALYGRPDRAAYKRDFDVLWNRQAKHLGLSEADRAKIEDAIFFQRPLAFPQDNRAFCAYGRIINETTGEIKPAYRSPKRNLLFQEYRLWKLLADLKVRPADPTKTRKTKNKPSDEAQNLFNQAVSAANQEWRGLTLIEKEKAFELLNRQESVSWSNLAEEMGIKGYEFEPQVNKRTGGDYTDSGMLGNKIASWFEGLRAKQGAEEHPTNAELVRLWDTPERFLKSDLKQEWKGTPQGARDKVRHHLIRIIGEASFTTHDRFGKNLKEASLQRVVQIITADFDLSSVAAFRLATASFPDGYGSMSYTAMAKVIPHLREGKMEWEGIAAEFKQDLLNEDGMGTCRFLPRPPSEKEILSPRVRKALNQVRKVVNALLAAYPEVELDEIRIEMARRMQLSNDQYKELLEAQMYSQKMNEQARRIWATRAPGTTMPDSFPERWRMWVEQDCECPYTDGENRKIDVEHLINGDDLEVDHIWPRAIGGNQYGNKVLVFRAANQKKGDRAPWQMPETERLRIAENMERWTLFTAKVDSNSGKISDEKRVKAVKTAQQTAKGKIRRILQTQDPRFAKPGKAQAELLQELGIDPSTANASDLEATFALRQLVETGYITQSARKFLAPVAKKITPVKAGFTTKLAKSWGFYRRLNDLHAEDLAPLTKGGEERLTPDKKERLLHRHHALDALATALASPKLVHRIVQIQHEIDRDRQKLFQEALSEMNQAGREVAVPYRDAAAENYVFDKRLKAAQPKAIKNGLHGALANVVISHETKRKPSGKFFFEQPSGISKKTQLSKDGSLPPLNSWVNVKDLVFEQLFPEFGKKAKGDEEASAGKKGTIKSKLTRDRLRQAVLDAGLDPAGSDAKKKIEEFLQTDTDDDRKFAREVIRYKARKGQRYIRRVLCTIPSDVAFNYRIVDKLGGKTLYPKMERHCGVIYGEGKKRKMILIPLVDAAVADGAEDYRSTILQLAAEIGRVTPLDLTESLILHKGDMVWVGEEGGEELFRVQGFEGSGTIRLRAHWSGDTDISASKAVGFIRKAVSQLRIQLVEIDAVGRERS